MRGNLPMLVPFIIMKKSSHLFYFTRQKEGKQRRERKKGGWEACRERELYFQTHQSLFFRSHIGFILSCHDASCGNSAYLYGCNKHAPRKEDSQH